MRRYYCDLKRVYGFDWYCDIAERIAKAREEKGWTQAELQARFPMRKGEYDALQPDERKEA